MTAYEAATAKHNEAIAIFYVARDKFFAIKGIASKADFAEFAAAQAALKVANAEFDVAFEIAANLPEEVEVVAEYEDTQMEMFA